MLRRDRIVRSARGVLKDRHVAVDRRPTDFDAVEVLLPVLELVRQGEDDRLVDVVMLDEVERVLVEAIGAAVAASFTLAVEAVAAKCHAAVMEGRGGGELMSRQLALASRGLARGAVEERVYAAMARVVRQVLAADLERPPERPPQRAAARIGGAPMFGAVARAGRRR